MTSEELLAGITSDLVIRRVRMFLVSKGLPDGKYLLEHSKCSLKDGKYRGQIGLTLDEPPIRVVIVFVCATDPASNLLLEINGMIPRPGRGVDYLFSATLRPPDGEAS